MLTVENNYTQIRYGFYVVHDNYKYTSNSFWSLEKRFGQRMD